MKPSYVAVGVVGLALAGLWYAAGGAAFMPAQTADRLLVSGPVTHGNLTVFFVHGPDAVDDSRVVSLQDALDRGWAVVHETGSVNELAVENLTADREVFVQSGDLFKGGRQDRMAAADLLVPPNAGRVPVPAHCVERGRWTGRAGEADTRFAKSEAFAVGNEIKVANADGRQSEVWESVKKNQERLNRNLGIDVTANPSPSSFQLALEHPAVQARVGEYEAAVRPAAEGRRGVVGAVFVVNGRVTGAEVYGSGGLFKMAWPKLVRSAAVEALVGLGEKAAAPPSPAEVERFLASAAKPAPAGETPPPRTDEPETRAALMGRSGATRTGVVVAGGGTREERERFFLNDLNAAEPPPINPGLPVIPAPNAPPANPAGQNPLAPELPAGRNPATGNLARPQPAPPVNPNGNRLNTNRVENGSALMLESRDAAKGAVVHRSYIKK